MIITPLSLNHLPSLPSSAAASSAAPASSGGFANLLSEAMQSVNGTVQNAEQQGIALAAGTAPSVASVMEAATQAQLAVDMTVQVRDRVVQAYNQIMSMQV
ncbi:MAG: flagellar hook-basal body complex protein FliE [Firmicutes bacterium]|nr:flagellar hook-basal body complex protein FliE [Bacillota bacterium]